MNPPNIGAWREAFRQAETELEPHTDGVTVSRIVFSSFGDMVVFHGQEGSFPRAWVYDPEGWPERPGDASQMVEFARLSMLGDLIPPADFMDSPRRPNLREWSVQFKGVRWCGAVN